MGFGRTPSRARRLPRRADRPTSPQLPRRRNTFPIAVRGAAPHGQIFQSRRPSFLNKPPSPATGKADTPRSPASPIAANTRPPNSQFPRWVVKIRTPSAHRAGGLRPVHALHGHVHRRPPKKSARVIPKFRKTSSTRNAVPTTRIDQPPNFFQRRPVSTKKIASPRVRARAKARTAPMRATGPPHRSKEKGPPPTGVSRITPATADPVADTSMPARGASSIKRTMASAASRAAHGRAKRPFSRNRSNLARWVNNVVHGVNQLVQRFRANRRPVAEQELSVALFLARDRLNDDHRQPLGQRFRRGETAGF
jgi:hypothetical protein